jgi:type II secretory pathway pseudopilin PulG
MQDAPQAKSVRRHLFEVLLVTVVPLGLLAAGLFYLLWQSQERERERLQIQSTRLLAAAVDNALDGTVQRLNIFARQWTSSQASDAAMHRQSREVLAASPDWTTLSAFRADGTALFRADLAFDTPLQDIRLFDIWQPVIREQRALVSDTFISPSRGVQIASVGVPVVSGGKVTQVLVANLNLLWYDDLLNRQGALGGIAGIFDRNWKFVARTVEGDKRRGTDPTRALVEDIKRSPEGIGRYTNLNGTAVYTSWTGSRHGWWVAFATPSAPVDNAFWTYFAAFSLAWAAVAALGVAYAMRTKD